ncbi:MAG: MATE family efflux transporter [Phycisphaerales bacterium]|nr:MATE family efflux transporter [Phycisphaerales bacterium]
MTHLEEVREPGALAAQEEDSGALMELLRIAGPSVATMASYTVMQFVDKLMVKEIGPDPVYIAAQGNGGVTAWTAITFVVGMSGVVSSFVSQNLGAGKPQRGSAYAWNAMWIGLAYWLMLMLPALLLIRPLFEGYGHDGELLRYEVQYAQILVGCSVVTILTKSIQNYFFGLHRPGVVLVATVLGNLTNIGANYALIFGHLGFPEMGVAGAAWGTVIGTSVELLIPLAVFLSPGFHERFGTRRAWRVSVVCVRDLFRVGWPAGLTFLSELVCWQYLMSNLIGRAGERAAALSGASAAMVERAGTVANTAGFIGLQYMHLSFMPAVGISIATQAVVGKAIGAGRPDLAVRRTWLALSLTVGYMGACALMFVLFRTWLVSVFVNRGTGDHAAEVAGEVIRVGGMVMLCGAVFQVFDAMAITMSAALRGAGDTVWPGLVTVVVSWGCIMGLGHVVIEVFPQWGSLGPWSAAAAYIILLSFLYLWRFLGGKWKSIKLTHDDPLHNLPPDPMAPGASPGAA